MRTVTSKTQNCFVALAIAASFPGVAMAQMPASPSEPAVTRLDVQARGVVRVAPDRAIITAGVVTQAPDAQMALRQNADHMARVLAALRSAGIADRDIRTQIIGLVQQYRYPANEPPVPTGYQANNSLSISIDDIARVGPIIDTLVKQGVNEINGPSFIVSQRSRVEDQARLEALGAFQARAALYAKAMGLHVRRIISLSETADVAPPMPFLTARAMVIDANAPKTRLMSGQEDVAITLTGVVELGDKP